MSIDYSHARNLHTISGARSILPIVLSRWPSKTLLDVGCGTGTWLRAAAEAGVEDTLGLDGVDIAESDLLIPPSRFKKVDFTRYWSVARRFDLALCLEVGEHLEKQYAVNLVQGLTAHADRIVFSAACPGQVGQHHVNCQWPEYWQQLFNENGFTCDDALRWGIWDLESCEPWYRQNIFAATKNPSGAGQEPRLKRVIHPEMLEYVQIQSDSRLVTLRSIEQGGLPAFWYLKTLIRACSAKMTRRLR